MSVLAQLVGFGLRQVIGDFADNAVQIVGAVEMRFRDHSQTLPKALDQAHNRAWQALGVALAGDGLLDRVKVFFASGDDKGVREQVQVFLNSNAVSFDGAPAAFRRDCLDELKRLRKSGLLAMQGGSPAEIARQAAGFRRHADPQGLVEEARRAVAGVADALAEGYPNLARLLRAPTPAGPPLLAAAFCYFFRREVETDDELARGLTFNSLRQLTARQEAGFDEVQKALCKLGGRVDELLEQVLDDLQHIRRVGDETRDRVEDLHGELRKVREEIRAAASRNNIRAGRQLPRVAVTINNAEEQERLRRLWGLYKNLPAEVHSADDLVLLGETLDSAALFDLAQDCHETAARAAHAKDQAQEAEALFKAYRAACQRGRWDDALHNLLRAAEIAPARFDPFPVKRYQPQRILGAGGFGAVFLCRDLLTAKKQEVAIKALDTADLDRSVEEVFTEAEMLHGLHHPAVIAVRHWDYADVTRMRPYIVMEFFPNSHNLHDHFFQNGKLRPADLVAVARLIAEGMATVHGLNVLHRDLKPDNVLVRCQDGVWEVKVIDFGLAVRQEAVATSVANQTGRQTAEEKSFAGTYKYAPPEQKGELPGVGVGKQSDVYTFGKTCCEALFGTTEPTRWDYAELPERYKPLALLLERCTAGPLKYRPTSFGEVVEALKKLDPIPGEIVANSLGMKFAWCPPGKFIMGSPQNESERSDNEIQHKVTLTKGFWMGVHQVTQSQWQAVMGGNPSTFQGDDLPVENVSWDYATAFCEALGRKDGKKYRLPTEAEWEYACRAGTTTAFHFGATISTEQANYNGNYRKGKKGVYREKTTPVGSFPGNAWGLFDMHGNVWEWCQDRFGVYHSTEIKDPQGNETGDARVSRGGCWYSAPLRCRSAYRSRNSPAFPYGINGCRVVLCLD